MKEIAGYIISGIIGIILAKLYDILIAKIKRKKEDREREQIKPKDILEDYVRYRDVESIVSYGDSHAIKIEPIMQYGKPLLKARIDISQLPNTKENRQFVMVLLKYIPNENWKYYSEKNYLFKFKIRGTISAIQLEIKDPGGNKIIDRRVEVKDSFKEYAFALYNAQNWERIDQICFTVFCENDYISEGLGNFEIMDCRLER